MGTRADFYVGRGKDMEWLGSIAYDGYPDGVPEPLFEATSEGRYRQTVEKILSEEDSASRPADGWPWPWDTSATTDYAYTFEGKEVLLSCFGEQFHTLAEENARTSEDLEEEPPRLPRERGLPNMSKRRVMAEPGTKRSGMLAFKIG